MPNIKNVSSLRNYTKVLDEVKSGSPVFLVKGGQGRYAILDMNEYDSLCESLWNRLYDDLDASRALAEKEGWVSHEIVKRRFGSNVED